jgi:hypothetical protein
MCTTCYSVKELALCPYFSDIPFVYFSDYTLLILIIICAEIIDSSGKHFDLCPRGVRFESCPEHRGFLEFCYSVQKKFWRIISMLQNIILIMFIKFPM